MTDETLFSHRIFKFNSSETKDSLNITIPEVIGASYGLFVWPCAPVLAQYIWYHCMKIEKKTVLEIGCGTALPGIVAAKLGAKVILSDSSEFPHCLERAKQSLSANGLSDASVVEITWGQFSSSILELGPVDIILGSDCFYDTKDFEAVLVTVAYLLQKNRDAEFWTTYQIRSSNRSIEHLLLKWNLSCRSIPLSSFEADSSSIAGSSLPGCHTIQMFVIKYGR